MSRWLSQVGLPQRKVTLAAVSAQAPEVAAALEQRGCRCILAEPVSVLSGPVQHHTDLQMSHMGGREVLAAPEAPALQKKLEQAGFHLRSGPPLQAGYPGEILYNVAFVGEYCFCGRKNPAYPIIQEICEYFNKLIVPVAQGYCRCNICAVNEHALLTEDPSIAQAAERCGLSVCMVSAGAVRLDGYPYGFLGGCCGKIGPDQLAFAGELEQHPDAERIQQFLTEHGVQAVSLQSGPLTDIGGILPLMQQPLAADKE